MEKLFENIYSKSNKLDESVYVEDNSVLVEMYEYNMADDEKVEHLMDNGYDREDAERLVDSLNSYGYEYGFPEDEDEAEAFIAGYDDWEPWRNSEED